MRFWLYSILQKKSDPMSCSNKTAVALKLIAKNQKPIYF